jgi:hypothetical protein
VVIASPSTSNPDCKRSITSEDGES